ncbi:MAG: VWA domain-containing protein [Synergistaceae bacterium]|jgi:stress response protein SCP2|nr:VWA domain-containing protein [Synergistaceae bacterium]
MAEIQRGFRGKIDDYFNSSNEITIEISVLGKGEYDSCCFGVDAADKLSDENYMIFFNQTASPKREIVLNGSGANISYNVNLAKLPSHIYKLVFTVSIDGSGDMGEIQRLSIRLSQGSNALSLNMTGTDFHSEKAVIAIEIYKKDFWRVAAVASGFNGGLSALLKHYGGVEDTSAAPRQESIKSSKVSLEKRIEKEAPQLVSLVKPLKVSLEKHNLMDVVAQVALLIDISGSMQNMFNNGTVQRIIDKIVPLAMQFDDNGEFELWYFGVSAKRMSSVTIKNYSSATFDWDRLMSRYGGGTNLAPAVEDVVDEYKNSKIPAYVLCITDGATSKAGKVKDLISQASDYPIFWQFIGVGRGNYGILEELDTMAGRRIDNANFFILDDIDQIDNTELYSRMLAEFPSWLKEAGHLGIV